MATLPSDFNVDNFGFAKKVQVSEQTGSRNLYMSTDKNAGFSRAQNLTMQLCAPFTPLISQFDLSEPKQGNMARWSLDLDVPVGSELYSFLENMNKMAREEIRTRAMEVFPQMKTESMSDDQINMCFVPLFKAAENGASVGRIKIKIIMPPTEEDNARLSPPELERRRAETTNVFEVTTFDPPSDANPTGTFEHDPSDHSILKAGCRVMPIIQTAGIWLNKSQCGISFTCTSICVWRAPEKTGITAFNLGGVIATKRKRTADDQPDDGYAPYEEAD